MDKTNELQLCLLKIEMCKIKYPERTCWQTATDLEDETKKELQKLGYIINVSSFTEVSWIDSEVPYGT